MNNRLKISFLCFLVGSSVFNVKCGRTDGSENNQDEQRVNNMAFESAVRGLREDFNRVQRELLELHSPTFNTCLKSLMNDPYPAMIGAGLSMICCFLVHKKK